MNAHERQRSGEHFGSSEDHGVESRAVGRRTLTTGLVARAPDGNGVQPGAEQAVAQAAGSGGVSLPEGLRSKFEGSLGADLGGVRVHTGADSAEAASAVGARAYAVGQDIHFGAGEYTPGTASGEHLLAHEVAHTVQQGGASASGGARAAQFKLEVSTPGDAHEAEADQAADAMVVGERAAVAPAHGLARTIMRASFTKEGDTKKAVAEDRKDAVATADVASSKLEAKWDAMGGNKLLGVIRAELAAWKAYRATPTTGMKMPGRATFAAVVAFSLEGFTPALREHASRQLGPANLTLLEEMICVNHSAEGIAKIFNVKYRDVKHHYSVSFEFAKGVTTAKIHYRNNLPASWDWTSPPTVISGMTFSINVLKGGADDKGALPIPVSPGLEISGDFEADSLSYWGWRDFGGAVNMINFPSAGIKTPLGGAKVGTGVGITFTGGPGGKLSMDNLKVKLSGTPGKPSIKDNPGDKVSYSIGYGGGIGAAVVGGDSDAKTKITEVSKKARLVDASKEFRVRMTNFANGSDALPADAAPELRHLVETIKAFVHREMTSARPAEALRQHGIDPDQAFQPTLEVQGWASMRWASSLSEPERLEKNRQLSSKRAQAAATELMGAWGPWTYRSLEVKGMGPGVPVPNTTGPIDSADQAKQKLAGLELQLAAKRQELARAKKLNDAIAAAKLAQDIEGLELEADKYKDLMAAGGAKTQLADEEWIRQAVVQVRWSGKLVDLGSTSMDEAAGATTQPPGASPTLTK